MSSESLPKPPENPDSNKPVNENRRLFLRGARVITTGAVVGHVAGKGIGATLVEMGKVLNGKTSEDYRRDLQEAVGYPNIERDIFQCTKRIEKTYNIKIVLSNSDIKEFNSTLLELRPSKQIEALKLLELELAKYPSFMIKDSGVLHVIIASNYKDGERIHKSGFMAEGHPDAQDKSLQPYIALLYDWNSGDETPRQYKKHTSQFLGRDHQAPHTNPEHNFPITLHHELAHYFFDVPSTESSPRLSDVAFNERWKDATNAHLLSTQQQYRGSSIVTNRDGTETFHFGKIPPLAGFARQYGLLNSEEDRTTVVELLLGNKPLTSPDPILKQKIDLIKDHYFKMSCGLMDDSYWSLIHNFSQVQNSETRAKCITAHFRKRAHEIIQKPYEIFVKQEQKAVIPEDYRAWQYKLKISYPTVAEDKS